MRPTILPLMAVAACTVGPHDMPECRPDPSHLDASVCLEASAELPPDTGATTWIAEGVVHGTVTEIGPATSGPAGFPVGSGLPVCESTEHIVRILDDAGVTWTFGWAVSGARDALPSSLPVGTAVTLEYSSRDDGYSYDRYVVVSDAVRPRLVFSDLAHEDSHVPGLSVDLQYRQQCHSGDHDFGYAETPVAFSTDAEEIVLHSGESATVDTDDASMEVLVPGSWTMEGCDDGCSVNEYIGWD